MSHGCPLCLATHDLPGNAPLNASFWATKILCTPLTLESCSATCETKNTFQIGVAVPKVWTPRFYNLNNYWLSKMVLVDITRTANYSYLWMSEIIQSWKYAFITSRTSFTQKHVHFRSTNRTFAQFVPAIKQVTSPPSLVAAVMVFRVMGIRVSLLCSATTSVLWNRWMRPV